MSAMRTRSGMRSGLPGQVSEERLGDLVDHRRHRGQDEERHRGAAKPERATRRADWYMIAEEGLDAGGDAGAAKCDGRPGGTTRELLNRDDRLRDTEPTARDAIRCLLVASLLASEREVAEHRLPHAREVPQGEH